VTRVLVLGRNGQLARALAQAAWPDGWRIEFAGRDRLDMLRLERIAPFLAEQDADVVINTAAYTAVDLAETERDAAFQLNDEAPGAVAQFCHTKGALLIHVSTDYVFGGAGTGPYDEDAPISPLSVYGFSKAAGEARALSAAADATVARTSWLMSPDAGFLAAILRRAVQGESLRVVKDQRGNPTLASDLAQALVRVTRDRLRGIGQAGPLHMAGGAEASWFDLAKLAIEAAGLDTPLSPASSIDHVLPAQRPEDSRLSTLRLRQNHGIDMLPWPDWVPDTARIGLRLAASRVETGQQSGG